MYNLNIGLRTPHLGGIRTHNVRCCCLCLFDRGLLLTEKLLKKGFLMVMLNSSLRTLSIRHHNLNNCYGYSPFTWIYRRNSNKSGTTGVTSGAGTVYPSGAPQFNHYF